MDVCTAPEALTELRRLLRRSWWETYRDLLGPATCRQLVRTLDQADLGGLVPSEDEQVIVARAGTQAVGMVVGAVRWEMLYAWGLYIEASHQRRGLGRQLLGLLVRGCEGCQEVEVTVLAASKDAVTFYRRCGFVEQGPTSYEIVPGLELKALRLVAPVERVLAANADRA